MTSRNGRAMYVGMTNDLVRRVWEHRQGCIAGFTARYHVTLLVYLEECGDVIAAIEREKQIKSWRRQKKNALVAKMNPQFLDLATSWYE